MRRRGSTCSATTTIAMVTVLKCAATALTSLRAMIEARRLMKRKINRDMRDWKINRYER